MKSLYSLFLSQHIRTAGMIITVSEKLKNFQMGLCILTASNDPAADGFRVGRLKRRKE